MSIELTPELRQALASAGETPPRLVDPETQTAYVLVRADVYEFLQELFQDDGPTRQEVAILVERVMREDDANDPYLESYQQYGREP